MKKTFILPILIASLSLCTTPGYGFSNSSSMAVQGLAPPETATGAASEQGVDHANRSSRTALWTTLTILGAVGLATLAIYLAGDHHHGHH